MARRIFCILVGATRAERQMGLIRAKGKSSLLSLFFTFYSAYRTNTYSSVQLVVL